MDSVNKAMTAAEKAALLEQYVAPVAAEAAAHFRALIPDANGLLPCPMCGAGALIKVREYKGMAWMRIQCRECALYTPMWRTEIEARRLWNRRCGVAYE